jgi:acyl-CoA synthetase (AMP-forming)/AMP-acid ligase II
MTWLAAPGLFIDELDFAPYAVAWMPNFAFSYLAQRYRRSKKQIRLDRVHAIINCSEPCKAPDMNRFVEVFASFGLPATAVRVCYAMAENVFAVTQTPERPFKSLSVDRNAFSIEGKIVPCEGSDDGSITFVSVGKPISSTQVRIGGSAKPGDVGEIEISGSSLCSGYYANAELTREKFADGWYRTGDYGFFDGDELYVTGRKDDVIIVRGRNIYAHDVEEIVNSLGRTRAGRCVTIGLDDATGTQQMIIIAESNGIVDESVVPTINKKIVESIGVSPRDIVIVDRNTLVKTSSGKISRSENAARYVAGRLDRWDATTKIGK